MKKAYRITFALASIALLASCNLEVNPPNAALMTAINYEGDQRIIYSLDDEFHTPGYSEAHIDPRPINKGDFKPVFSALQNRLGISMLEHQAAANSGKKKSVDYFRDNWMTKTYADITMGTVYDINNYSVAGNTPTILDLKPYIDKTKFKPDSEDPTKEIVDPDNKGDLPNIAKFLHDNPGVKLSVVTAKHGNPKEGAIYYVPYCDGFNDLEKSTIMRADYVERLLDDPIITHDDDESYKYPFSTDNTILGKEGEAEYTQHYEPRYVTYPNDSEDRKAPAYNVKVPQVQFVDGKDPAPTGAPVEFKKAEVENIIDRQNRLIKSGNATSAKLAKQFREYIDERYAEKAQEGKHPVDLPENKPFVRYSDLFLGYDACYDADELVALMRLVKVSSETLFPGKKKEIVTMMPRACDNMRSSDLYRWAGQIFGVKGLESRNMYMTINGFKDYGEDGKYGHVYDVRGTNDMLFILQTLKSLYDEGLILEDFDSKTATGTSEGKFADETLYSGGSDKFAGFMVYDYPKDFDDYNRYQSASTKDDEHPCDWATPEGVKDDPDPEARNIRHDYSLRAVVGAIANWDTTGDGARDDGAWFPFTESWSNVKTSASCLNAKLELPGNEEKLKAALSLIDYVYSDEGKFLYNFGPYEDGYITELAGNYQDGRKGVYDPAAKPGVDYIEYQGTRYPALTEEALKETIKHSNYQRKFVGATLPFGFVKLNAVPYQTMHDKTRRGVDIINYALAMETFKHILIGGYTPQQVTDYKTPFYQITPSTFFLTKGQSSAISALMDKNKLGSMFTDSSSSNFNIWDSIIMNGEAKRGNKTITMDNYIQTMEEWQIHELEAYYQDAFELMTGPVTDPAESHK